MNIPWLSGLVRAARTALRKAAARPAKWFFERHGLMVRDKRLFESVQRERDAAVALYLARPWKTAEPPLRPLECIVFSKDRPLQLHAFLSSFYEKTTPAVPVHVLYQPSSPACRHAYEEVEAIFTRRGTAFIPQQSPSSFRDDLIALLGRIRSGKLLFFVDDILFTEDVDLDQFCRCDTDECVPTLRMGLNVKRSYTMQVPLPLPEFTRDGTDRITWLWAEGAGEWAYPLSVDGHVFSTREITAMIRCVPFKAPNSLERALQRFRPLFLPRRGLAFPKSRILNIPCNKVQDEETANLAGGVHQDFLLTQWQRRLQMDYRKLYGFVNDSPHQECEFALVPRTEMNAE